MYWFHQAELDKGIFSGHTLPLAQRNMAPQWKLWHEY